MALARRPVRLLPDRVPRGDLASVCAQRRAGQDQARPRPSRRDIPRAPGDGGRHPRGGEAAGDQILVQLPGVKDVAQAKRLLISVAQLSLHIVEEIAPTREMLLQSSQGIVPPALQVVEGQSHAPGENVFYLLRRQAVMTGRDLKTARVGVGDQGEPNVQFTLDAAGAARFKQETGRNIGRRLAIVLDERVTSAPLIEQPVGAEGRIRGHFTAAEADDLAKVLRAGALPAKMRYVQELTVGASLGRDSIRAGLIASAAALLFVTFC